MARRRKGNPVSGWVLLDKPEGITSTQAVGRVRRLFNAQKAGHAGTLDPLACGVLPIALGEATKTVPYVMDGEKAYEFIVKWGEATTTDDREGEVVETSDHRPEKADIEAILHRFVGEISQKPPAFSAIKVEGERAYKLARKGDLKELPARLIRVDALSHLEELGPNEARFQVACGKGTYVRSLARDLALELGTVGHVSLLRRTKVGSFDIKATISLEKLEELGYTGASQEALLPVTTALDDIPALAVSSEEAQRIRQGRAISLTRGQADKVCGAEIAYTTLSGQIVAIGDVKEGQFFPTRVFNLPLKGKIADVDYC